MTSRVIVEREISLNGKRYPLGGDGKVRTVVTSQYPQKLVLGDVDKDSNPRTSVIVWDDWTGGIGLYSTNGKEGMTRSLYNRLETRFKGHLTLPKVMVSALDPSVSGTINEIDELGSLIHAALNGGTDAYSYDPSDNTWSGKIHDFPAAVTDSLHFTLGGTEYVAFAHTGGYSYSSNGTSYDDDTTDTLHMAFWDDRLWGIDNTGQLWFASTIGTEVNDAKLSLPAGYVNGLFTGPDASGEDILYASTEVGLYAHDAANARFIKTKVAFPQHSEGGKGAATWNGDIYVCPGGMALWRYDPVRGVIGSVGLDRDSGLQSGQATELGDIVHLVPVHTGIIAQVDTSGLDTIWEYDGVGWHFIHFGSGTYGTLHASSVNGSYRLYLSDAARLEYRVLDSGHVNPDTATITYDLSSTTRWFLITPWFNAGQNEIDKTAIRLRLDCRGMSASVDVLVEYGIDYGTGYYSGTDETLTVESNGVTTVTFPTIGNNLNEEGRTFSAIRFKLTFRNTGGTATLTPNVKSLSLEWRRKIPARYGFEFAIDRSESYGGRTPKEMKADLITAIETAAQVEFTFVDDDGSTQNYYVDVTNMEDVEDTGHGETGQTRIAVVEA